MNTNLVSHVISIWPLPLRARRTLFQPMVPPEGNVWEVPAASPDEPQIIVLHQYKQVEETGSGKNTTIIDASAMAADLVNEWAAHKMAPKGRPGVWVADDIESQYDGKITLDQVRASAGYSAAVRSQQEFALSMVAEARELFRGNKQDQITETHFVMANVIGVRNESWQDRLAVETVSTKCFACGELVPASALVCRNCKEVLDPQGLEQQREARRVMSGTAVDPMEIDPMALDMGKLEALTAPGARAAAAS